MSGELVRWRAEAEALATAWMVPGEDRAPLEIRIEREDDRSFLRIAYADGGARERQTVDLAWTRSSSAAVGSEGSDDVWWDRLRHGARGAVTTEQDRRQHEAAAAAALWIEKPYNVLVEDRETTEFSLVRRGPNFYVTFVDEWAGQRERVVFPVWLERHGGVDTEAVGDFWLGLAEGTVTGVPIESGNSPRP